MLKKKLYLNYTNLILEKTKVCIFYVNSFFDKRTSQTHTMMLLSFKSYIQIFPIANLKLPLNIKTFDEIKEFFEFLSDQHIILIFYKKFFVVNKKTTKLLYSFFFKSFLQLLKYKFLTITFFIFPKFKSEKLRFL